MAYVDYENMIHLMHYTSQPARDDGVDFAVNLNLPNHSIRSTLMSHVDVVYLDSMSLPVNI